MDDFKPFLQIVHISDLHVIDPRSLNAVSVRGWIRAVGGVVSTRIATWIDDGVAPYDPLAVPLFNEFLDEITTKDPKWSECKTWLVDTGDLTSLGDQDSLDLGRKYLKEFAQFCSELASIYGNHDAWPGTFPLVAGISEVAKQRRALTTRQYAVATPGLALRTPIPHGAGEVQLYFMDSVRHDRWHNFLALGEVSGLQLDALKTLVDQNCKPDRYDFRILAVHHPVHYPPPRPRVHMSMSNDSDVARVLDTPSPAGAYPLAHLVLSGHLHFLYPRHGQLPLEPSLCLHPDLGNNQCQFLVGTLMQLDKYNKRLGWPHQCQVLRLYYSGRSRSVLVMERLLAARQGGNAYRGTGIGPYKFVSLPQNSHETAEEITFPV